jgi:hypothetical protein
MCELVKPIHYFIIIIIIIIVVVVVSYAYRDLLRIL